MNSLSYTFNTSNNYTNTNNTNTNNNNTNTNNNNNTNNNTNNNNNFYSFCNPNDYLYHLNIDNIQEFNLNNQVKVCRVIDVYDGDTITVIFEHFGKINKWKVRLYGINTPELRPSRSLDNRDEIIDNARKARDFLKSLIMNPNQLIYLECKEFDSFGRILANIYLYYDYSNIINNNIEANKNKFMVNRIMINSSHAIEYKP
jgi:endonuclease YncB( thermonuclease family)